MRCFCYAFSVRIILAAVVLWAGPILGQATPSRPLLDEMLTAEQRAHPATVRTHYAVGNAFMLDGTTVIAALHSVLTPSGVIADEIGVNFPRPPLNNMMQSRSVPIAQDPGHDLILLEIEDYRPGPNPVVTDPASVPAAPGAAAPKSPVRACVGAPAQRKPKRLSPKMFAFREHPPLNIVDDGPTDPGPARR